MKFQKLPGNIRKNRITSWMTLIKLLSKLTTTLSGRRCWHMMKMFGNSSKSTRVYCSFSMVLHYLEQATTRVISDTASQPVWDLQITQAVNSAAAIIQHLNTQKLIMLSTGEVEPFTGATALTNRMVRLLMMESRSADWIIYPSEVAQKKVG